MTTVTTIELISGDWNSTHRTKTIESDVDNAFNWTRIETITDYYPFDYPGPFPQNKTTYFDDGAVKTETYKIFTDPYYKVLPYTEEIRDALNRVTKLKAYKFLDKFPFSPIGATQTVWDVNDSRDWAKAKSSFNSTNHRTYLLYDNDDGSRIAYQWDPENKNPFARVVTRFDKKGLKVSTFYENDDGRKVLYEFDRKGYSWSKAATYFDANGAREKVVYDNDDGTHTAYFWNGGQESVVHYTADWIVL